MRPTLLLALLLAIPPLARAHHTGTPPIVRFTSSGDNDLPRLPAFGSVLGLTLDEGATHPVVSLKVFDHPDDHRILDSSGMNANPATAMRPVVAWDSDADPLGSGDPGRQVFLSVNGVLSQVTHDQSGTSANPSVTSTGTRVSFESAGNLTGDAPPGTQQIYSRSPNNILAKVSLGSGSSANAGMDRVGKHLVFDSTSDPADGHDTGVPQIWLSTLDGTPAQAITTGLGASGHAEISSEGKVVVFESASDLAHGGTNTGIPQIFAYDVKSKTFAQVTADATGCTGPSVRRTLSDWRVAFVCGAQAYYYDLRHDQRYHVQTPGGDVSGIHVAFGTYFLGVSTTANLLAGSGTTPGHQIYLVNLWKRPADPVAGVATWFPTRGIKPLH